MVALVVMVTVTTLHAFVALPGGLIGIDSNATTITQSIPPPETTSEADSLTITGVEGTLSRVQIYSAETRAPWPSTLVSFQWTFSSDILFSQSAAGYYVNNTYVSLIANGSSSGALSELNITDSDTFGFFVTASAVFAEERLLSITNLSVSQGSSIPEPSHATTFLGLAAVTALGIRQRIHRARRV